MLAYFFFLFNHETNKKLMFVFVLKEMSSLAERLRNRAERKPLYNDNESDEDLDLLHGGVRSAETKPERITRADAV